MGFFPWNATALSPITKLFLKSGGKECEDIFQTCEDVLLDLYFSVPVKVNHKPWMVGLPYADSTVIND